jgi:hypothetical protein
MKTVVDTTAVIMMKPWLSIDRIFNGTELGKKYDKTVKCERNKIMKY